ncbi:MAG: hypothetical protein RLZZ387_4616 [Chloroflexota bacterium]
MQTLDHLSATAHAPASSAHAVDFDLYGLVGIRLLDASPRDAAAVERQIGPLRGRLERPPDITIRFVDRLPVAGTVRLLGLEEGAFTDDAFLVLRSKHGARVRAQIPLAEVGRPCEIVCERGIASVPLLKPIINLAALGRGTLPLHASAFLYRGVGVITTGWQQGSKTGTLLAFMARGARFVADDWVYLSDGGARMHGIPEPIHLRDGYLRALPQYRAAIGARERVRLDALRAAQGAVRAVAPRSGGGLVGRALRRAAEELEGQAAVRVHPQTLFGPGACEVEGTPQVAFLTVSRDAPGVEVRPADPEEIAQRMVFTLQYERLNFMAHYRMFQFAFPGASNPVVATAEERERDLLRQALAGKRVYVVYHSYPASVEQLYAAMSPLVVQ